VCGLVSAAFQCIVRALFNLLVVQFAASVSCKLSADERKAWMMKGQTAAGCTKLESLLSRVIGLLSGSPLFHLPDSLMPAVSCWLCLCVCLSASVHVSVGINPWMPTAAVWVQL